MKKTYLLFVCTAFILNACSFTVEEIFLLPTPTRTGSPTPVLSPTRTSTITPTLPTPTQTGTPTLVGAKSAVPTFIVDLSATPTIPFLEITPNTPTAPVSMEGFISITLSTSVFYYEDNGCGPDFVKFTAQVGEPAKAVYVVLSARFKSKQSGATSEWTGLTMENKGGGTFVYELHAQEMKAVNGFNNPWIQYQLIVTTKSPSEILGKTDVYDERLSVMHCEPTPTPTVEPTSTSSTP